MDKLSCQDRATDIHGMTAEELAGAPTFDQAAQATEVLDGRHVLAFNAAFDRRLLKQTYQQYRLKPPAGCRWTYVQDLFTIHFGDWSDY